MRIWCGIDLAGDSSAVSLVDATGAQVAAFTICNDPDGIRGLRAALREATHGRTRAAVIAVEDPSPLLPRSLAASGFTVFAVSPVAASRYRKAHRLSGSKSDGKDAFDLANMVRVEPYRHHLIPGDSEAVLVLRALTRAQLEQINSRRATEARLHALLASYYPAALKTFRSLTGSDARAVLPALPTPTAARAMRVRDVEKLLRETGRQRAVEARAASISAGLRSVQLQQPPQVELALGRQARALLAELNVVCTNADTLAADALEAFKDHPQYKIVSSFPGLGGLLGARVLAEIGDDPRRFAGARGLQALAGMSPITRTSGGPQGTRVVTRRYMYNRRLSYAVTLWMFQLRRQSEAARADYERRRALGDRYNAAVRHGGNRYIGVLAHCLRESEPYDEARMRRLPVDAPT
jgi:transposase